MLNHKINTDKSIKLDSGQVLKNKRSRTMDDPELFIFPARYLNALRHKKGKPPLHLPVVINRGPFLIPSVHLSLIRFIPPESSVPSVSQTHTRPPVPKLVGQYPRYQTVNTACALGHPL